MRFASLVAVLMLAVWGALTQTATGEDDFWQRPPLTWEDIERPLRSFCDVDQGAEWTAAWPKIEDAYLQFLTEEDVRRAVDAKPLAEQYEAVALGFATDNAVLEYARQWRAHLARCAAAEDALLDAVVQLVPERDRDEASALPRGRKIARLHMRGVTNAPLMVTATRLVLNADLSADARPQARVAIRAAEESMLAQLVILARAGDEFRDTGARQQAELSRRGRENQSLDSEDIAAFQLGAEREFDRSIEAGGRAYAAIERIGVDAVLAMVASWSQDDRRKAISAVSETSGLTYIADSIRVRDQRVATALRRRPVDEAKQAALAAAREALIDGMVAFTEGRLRDRKAEALVVEQHLRDCVARRPSSLIDKVNANSSAREKEYSEFVQAWIKAVRDTLEIPADDPWPRRRPEDLAQPQPLEDPDVVDERELDGWRRGLGSYTWAQSVWCRPLPDAASVLALATRLGLDQPATARWAEIREQFAIARDEAVSALEQQVVAAAADEKTDVDTASRTVSELWSLSQSKVRELTEALRTALPAEDQRNPSFEVWANRQRTMTSALALRRGVHTIAQPVIGSIPWLDRAGNPLEVLDTLELPVAERATLDGVIQAESTRFANAAEALDEVELRTSMLVVIEERKAIASWNSKESAEVRIRAWLANKDWAVGLLDATTPAAQARAAASKALRETIVANLSPDRRTQFERAARNCALPGIDHDRPRFERPFLAAISLVAPDPERAAAVTKAYTSWDESWEAHSARMAALDNGGAYRALSRRMQLSGAERHGAAVLRWIEVRRREESIVALRRAGRLLTAEERAQVRGLSPTA